MARSYAYALWDAPYPPELNLYHAVETLGTAAVFGTRVLTPREIRDLMNAKAGHTLIGWFKQREMSQDYSKWAEAHPAETRALELAHREFEAWQKK
jgi:hypothetical protein